MFDYNKYSRNVELRGVKLSNLLVEILKKWKIVLLVSIIMALIFLFMGVVNSKTNENEEELITKDELNKDDLEYLQKMEVLEMQLENLREYRDNSVKMNTDAHEKYFTILEYKLEADEEVENLCFMYRNYIIGGGLTSDISSKTDVKERDLLDNIGIRDIKQSGEETISNVLIVQISHYDKDKRAEIASLVDSAILNYNIKIMQPYNIIKTAEYSGVGVDNDMQTQQDNVLRSISDKENSLSDIEAKLSVNALKYLNNQSSGNVDTEKVASTLSAKKSLLLGFLIGVVLACIIIAISYVFDNTIKSVDEIGAIYHTRVYGTIKRDENERKLQRIFKKKVFLSGDRNSMSNEQKSKLLCTKIILACKEENISDIFLSFPSENFMKEDNIENIMKTLSKAGIEIYSGIGMIYNPEVLEKANSIKNVILIEGLRYTLYNEMASELQLCEEYGINVMGTIVLN